MGRPEKSRKISHPPLMKGFKPYGIPHCEIETVRLSFEEYESIRLVNYESRPQKEAASLMQVSRPTLTRIYNRAITTITKAFVEGKAIEIKGGNYDLDHEWYRCKKCHKLIEGMENHVKCKNCTDFMPTELIYLNNI